MEDIKSGDGHASGVHSSQPEGRTGLPPVDNSVLAAKDAPGTTVRCAKIQTGENRYPINSHAEKNHTHGPNN